MEFLIEIVLQLFGELLLQFVVELLAEAGAHVFRRDPSRRRSPVLAAALWALVGAALGALSLWLWPQHLLHDPMVRLGYLVVAPLAVGQTMVLLGRWRERRGQTRTALDRFATGWLFALAFALVRQAFAG